MLLRRIVLLFFFLPALIFANQPALEYKVKAAYLYNFTKFITWPPNNRETFGVCILGAAPFGSLLEPLELRTAFGKPIRVLHLDSTSQLDRCDMLYIDNEHSLDSVRKRPSLTSVLALDSLKGVLTVSSEPFFAKRRGMIGFVIKDGRIKLQMNLAELKKNGLKVSAKLLEVAELVEAGDHE